MEENKRLAASIAEAFGIDTIRIFALANGDIDVDLGQAYVAIRDGIMLVDEVAVDLATIKDMVSRGVTNILPVPSEWVEVDPDAPAAPLDNYVPLPEVNVESFLAS